MSSYLRQIQGQHAVYKVHPCEAEDEDEATVKESSEVTEASNPTNQGTDAQIKVSSGIESSDPDIIEELNRAAIVLQRVWRRSRMKEQDRVKKQWSNDILSEVLEASRAKKMRNKLRDIVIYSIFLFVFSSSTLADYRDSSLYYFAQNVRDQFIGVEFRESDSPTWGKNFQDIATIQEFYQWLKGPFLSAAYTSSSFDGDPTYKVNRRGYILGYGQIIGGIRIGQIRVMKRDCTRKVSGFIPSIESTQEKMYCYGSDSGQYSAEFESKDNFGTGYEKFIFSGWNSSDTMNERQLMFSQIRTEFHTEFPSPAFSVILPRYNETQANSMVDYLINSHYLDLQTRAVFVDINVYNVMLEYMVVLRLIGQIPPSGGMLPTYSAVAVPYSKNYFLTSDWYISCLNILVVVFYVYFILQEGIMISRKGLSYFRRATTWVQQLNLFIFVFVWAYKFSAIMHFPSEFPIDSDKFVSFRPYSESYMVAQYLNACNAFLCWFKMINYLSIIPHFSLLTDTLSKAIVGVSGFVFIFFIITYAYASAYLMAFGTKLKEYSTLSGTMITLLRSLLGDFDLDAMVREHYLMGPILFVMFVSVAVFVILNLLIAIIMKAYEKAEKEMMKKEEISLFVELWKYIGSVVQEGLNKVSSFIDPDSKDIEVEKPENSAVSHNENAKKTRNAIYKEPKFASTRRQVVQVLRKAESVNIPGISTLSTLGMLSNTGQNSLSQESDEKKKPNRLARIANLGDNDEEKQWSQNGASSESVELLTGMVLQLALQNERLQSRMDQLIQQVSDLATEARAQKHLKSRTSHSSQLSTWNTDSKKRIDSN